jgi:hypothetical protein
MAQTSRKMNRDIRADTTDEPASTPGSDKAHVDVPVKGGS